MDNLPQDDKLSSLNQKLKIRSNKFISFILLWAKNHILLSFLILVLVIPVALYLLQTLFLATQNKYILYNHQTSQAETRKKQQEEYDKLLKEQEQRSKATIKVNPEDSRKALGEVTINFILVKPLGLSQTQMASLATSLQSPKETTNNSLFFVKIFLENEAKKYNIRDFSVDIKVHGIYSLSSLEKVGDIAYIWDKDPFGTVKLQDSFDSVIKENNLTIPDNSLLVFLYFDDSFALESQGSAERFYEHKQFRSFASSNTGKAYVNVYNLAPDFAKTVVEVATHETLHLFGANDKYEESESVDRICSQRGRGDLEKNPAVPQETADIMCMYIEKEDDEFIRASFSDDSLVINSLTAKEIGWGE